jgi:hypothetical protein
MGLAVLGLRQRRGPAMRLRVSPLRVVGGGALRKGAFLRKGAGAGRWMDG